MGLKVVMKDGTPHKFYELDKISEILIFGSFTTEESTLPGGKKQTKITLEGMQTTS